MSKEMNDRDFKLLVREYFQQDSIYYNTASLEKRLNAGERLRELSKRILSELELFTQKDEKELPFKD